MVALSKQIGSLMSYLKQKVKQEKTNNPKTE